MASPISYTNRKGQTYFLSTATKKGKTRYVFSRSSDGKLLDSLPEGYEIAESVNGLVSLRKALPKVISEFELELVNAAIKKHGYLEGCRVESKADALIVHAPLTLVGEDDLAKMFPWAPPSKAASIRKELLKTAPYDPVMRFVLTDTDKRTFLPERMALVGGESRWWSIGRAGILSKVVHFVKHIGKDSFFELL